MKQEMTHRQEKVLRKAVPTFKKPEEVNRAAEFVVHQKKSEPEREEAVAI